MRFFVFLPRASDLHVEHPPNNCGVVPNRKDSTSNRQFNGFIFELEFEFKILLNKINRTN